MNRFKTSIQKQWPTLLGIFLMSLTVSVISARPILGQRSFMPTLACNDLIQITLDSNCYATVTAEMVLEDMVGVEADYYIEVSYRGVVQPDLDFDHTDINKTYDFKIWHIASKNSCWGKIKIEDKLAPKLLCSNDTVRCASLLDPDNIGFPIPTYYSPLIIAHSTIARKYIVYNWDACGSAMLSYEDIIESKDCSSDFIRKIYRSWTAMDEAGNISRCNDTICVLEPTEADIVYPHHYDNIDLPYLHCDDTFPRLPNGNPSPEFTGHPVPNGCSTLNATYSDLKIFVCESSYKILRRWIILNWCTGKLTEYNQFIKVIDDRAPVFRCPRDFTVGMVSYTCAATIKLPAPDSVQDCGSWTYDVFVKLAETAPGFEPPLTKDYIWYNQVDSSFYLVGAPAGRLWLIYIVTDACGNADTCQTEAGIRDNLPPLAICDQKTVVTLTTDGTAKAFAATFDDGSIDNCEIDSFKVRRMSDPCNNHTDVFGPYVEFCCLDIGNTVLVAFEVIDKFRNRNTCMVEVSVQEKESPVIIAPTDVTISCEFDRSDLNAFGQIRYKESDRKPIVIKDYYYSTPNYIAGLDGYAYDNCFVTVTEEVEYRLKCNQGEIIRKFTATDKQGLQTIAYQTIYVWNPRPFMTFDGTDIKWPRDTVIYTCRKAETAPSITGAPIFKNVNCAQVAANFDDLRLTQVDSVCYKILRTWTVVDWCQYKANPEFGIWKYTQLIYIKNSEPPTILSCNPLDVCDYASYYDSKTKLCYAAFNIEAQGEDDCTLDKDLIWKYRLDINNNGTYDSLLVAGKIAKGVLPFGTHRIRWILQDQCGNYSECDQVFVLRDCKKPTPYCLNGITTVVMPLNGVVSVWAKDLNLNSFDNCTQPDKLKYSFTSDTAIKSIIYNCDSLLGQQSIVKTVRIYVTDEAGNQDYCEAAIIIQDNNNVCPHSALNLSGNISREDSKNIGDVALNVINVEQVKKDSTMTNVQGAYAFVNLLLPNGSYIVPSKEDVILNGVTTYDILQIQKHILGQSYLTSPYKLIAADVNNSKSVTARDITDLRKLILGITNVFPGNSVWRFVPKHYVFKDPSRPWDFQEKMFRADIVENQNIINFIGVKIGDVDQSAKIGYKNEAVTRFNSNVDLVYGKSELLKSGMTRIPIMTNHQVSFDGFQLAVTSQSITGNQVNLISAGIEIQDGDYHVDGQTINLSWINNHSVHMEANTILFYIETDHSLTDLLSINPSKILPQMYLSNGEVANLRLNSQNLYLNADRFEVGQNIPNPFSASTLIPIEISQAGIITLSIIDVTGKVISKREISINAGSNHIEIQKTDINQTGVFIYKVESRFGSSVHKFMIKD